ncbi:isopentenyl-diphosphate Delta-isomerase [Halomonas binhaiensis]|uniref:Isopentenyl-diphosphate Delta-isomerase n=1 Tax=Halomonas binhaiensis TaxID=2562282 RepID=A0A5C1NIK9_9GAMM|nr:isopentenyl-diphosphate Delta-isomerase [Halomonas binhaiensis]QEM82258.1 isopentenyl-diphosphate Delta-isomerase [Halomonas binhaiensis]
MEEKIILIDNDDNPIGAEEKLKVHQLGLLHRAFSIFIFDSNGRLMLQRRALHKYHSAGLWTNTCCSHPRWGEATDDAATRRLREEMGFITNLLRVDSILYHAKVPGGLIEHEFDHIYIGLFDGSPKLNPDEADTWKWISISELFHEESTNPDQFTAWLTIIVRKIGKDKMEQWSRLAHSMKA